MVRLHVLVIDSERLVAQPLRQAGHDVAVASTCEEGLAMAHAVLYDAIIVQAAPPESASLMAWAELRQHCGQTPILLIVGRDAVESRVDGLNAGADGCISVPFALPELLARLRALVRRTHIAEPSGA